MYKTKLKATDDIWKMKFPMSEFMKKLGSKRLHYNISLQDLEKSRLI